MIEKKEWPRAVTISNSQSEQRIKNSMHILYLLAKEHVASSKLPALKELCADLGGGEMKHTLETSYEHYDSIRGMEQAISSVITESVLSQVKGCKWYSICIDESTDCSIKQCMIVYVKYVVAGEVHTDFLKLHELSGCASKDIYDALLCILHEHGLSMDKLAGIATDGASVMVGANSGVTTLLRKDAPYVVSIHCIAHWLALASSQAADRVPQLLKYQEILNRIFRYFHQSPKRTRLLQSFQDILNIAEKKFVQVFPTRWLSLNRCVQAVLKTWPALVSVLLEDNSAVGQGLLKSVGCYKFLAVSAYLSDILHVLQQMCLLFTKKKTDFETFENQVSCSIEYLKSLQNVDGPTFKEFLDKVPREVSPTGEIEFEGHTIKDNVKERQALELVRNFFFFCVITNLHQRFSDLGKLQLFRILLPKHIRSANSENFNDYGDKETCEIHTLLKSQLNVQKPELLVAWGMFKKLLVSRCKDLCMSGVHQLMITNDLTCDFPHMFLMLEYALAIPVHTVDCERGFSEMNLTKTPIRNRLDVVNLSTLMNISINGPP